MARIILLDSGPVGLACSRPGLFQVDQCHAWLLAMETVGAEIFISTIVDYEVRRELIRIGATAKLMNLDDLVVRFDRLDISATAMVRAAEYLAWFAAWAGPRLTPKLWMPIASSRDNPP
ncbi:MAG: hypothetical protein ABI353_10315 [Isosphaeraceae bacterium]